MNEIQTCEQQPRSALSSAGSIEEVLTEFDRHLEGQRGCTEGTRQHYRREARALLVGFFSDQPLNWNNLTAAQIADFVSGRAQKISLVSRQNPATPSRSLLRFLTSEGLILGIGGRRASHLAGDTVGIAVGQHGYGFLEIHDDWFGRPGAAGSDWQRHESYDHRVRQQFIFVYIQHIFK